MVIVLIIIVCLCKFFGEESNFFVFFLFFIRFLLCGFELVNGLEIICILLCEISNLGFVLISVLLFFFLFFGKFIVNV